MASLRDLQAGFASVLRGAPAAAMAQCVVANGIDPERRLGIYVNNVRENFQGTLEAAYPVVLRLAGRDWFRQAGRRYQLAHPSRHGNLHHLGRQYADWLATEIGDGPYAYFADVARLEWAYQEVLVAAEAHAGRAEADGARPRPHAHAVVVLNVREPTLRFWKHFRRNNWEIFAQNTAFYA